MGGALQQQQQQQQQHCHIQRNLFPPSAAGSSPYTNLHAPSTALAPFPFVFGNPEQTLGCMQRGALQALGGPWSGMHEAEQGWLQPPEAYGLGTMFPVGAAGMGAMRAGNPCSTSGGPMQHPGQHEAILQLMHNGSAALPGQPGAVLQAMQPSTWAALPQPTGHGYGWL